jgi:environmental stress-induced protein Ves
MAGYERIIAALAGPELILTHAGTGGDHRRSLAGGSAWLFAGEAATSSVKGAGDAARDFNVMVCRDAGAAHVWDLTPAVLAGWSARSSGAPWTAATRADAVALYAAAGAAEVGVGAEKGALGPGDLWIWERGAKVPSPTSPRETAPISVTPVGATLPRVLVVEIALSARDRTR